MLVSPRPFLAPVEGPDGTLIFPNRRTAPDPINLVEHIEISMPEREKEYKVIVEGTRVEVRQPYALVVTGGFVRVDEEQRACDAMSIYVGDGFCDPHSNRRDCGWDGGDCCSTSCKLNSDVAHNCGLFGYACEDTKYKDIEPAPDPDMLTCDVPHSYKSTLTDSYCDYKINVPRCNFDGGACCAETCEVFGCGKPGTASDLVDCRDPAVALPSCKVDDLSRVGDGKCDPEGDYNTEECGWDLGDCCPDTCFDGRFDDMCGQHDYTCTSPCPKGCSGHGTCTTAANGCECDDGFIGSECQAGKVTIDRVVVKRWNEIFPAQAMLMLLLLMC